MTDRGGSLSVVRLGWWGENSAFETFIKITADGSVTAYNGHVDLGTGIRTALGQIVAEELDVSIARVVVVLGDTSLVPNQGRPLPAKPSRSRRCRCGRRRRKRGNISSHGPPNGLRFGRGTLDRGWPDPRQGQPQRQLWRTDFRRHHSPRMVR